jgi:aminoglycoside/choline kinase family phosphotransferase
MDWPRQPDGPPVRDGLSYSRIAHLAEDVRPFVAVGAALAACGMRVPAVETADLDRGLLVLDDLGDAVLSRIVTPDSQTALWTAATDALVALRRHCPEAPAVLPLADGARHVLPPLDRGLLEIETELLLDWYWPLVHDAPAPADARAEFAALWRPVFDRLLALPRGWMLRDYHSPNLLDLADPGASGCFKVGVIDFQDAVAGPHAYDLVSLLQDARVDVPPALEATLFDRYCAAVGNFEPGFDRGAFRDAFAALGAERNTKILGIFARLARRDGKAQYLAHLPRIWRYLERDLAAPGLAGLEAWFDRAFPPSTRKG